MVWVFMSPGIHVVDFSTVTLSRGCGNCKSWLGLKEGFILFLRSQIGYYGTGWFSARTSPSVLSLLHESMCPYPFLSCSDLPAKWSLELWLPASGLPPLAKVNVFPFVFSNLCYPFVAAENGGVMCYFRGSRRRGGEEEGEGDRQWGRKGEREGGKGKEPRERILVADFLFRNFLKINVIIVLLLD